jgi:Ferredoxin-like domain in Api92-like protein
MPNWCYNSLTIEGSKEDISAIKTQLNKPFTRQHDQWNPATQQMELSDTTYTNPVFAFWNIIAPTNIEIYNLQKDPNHDDSIIDFKGDNWYDWNVRNWGTKWDVAVRDGEDYPETELLVEEDWSDRLGYRFNTAWSPPLQAIETLSAQYPNVEFNLSYEEETGWGGEYLFIDGNGTEIESYENKCRDCDAINTMEYCDNDCGEICLECNYLGEADMEAVAECEVHKCLI